MEIQIREGNSRQKQKLKVCAYCRVSTDADEQENSLENQIRHYKEVITSNPDYEYAGVYSDFAISGFKEKRPGLQKMLADARKGKIDLILTKSVSRFARNTSIVLEATRKLKELNVGVFFELQNINTLSGEGELMLTILAAFAQAESESGSVGAKMVYQRKYEAGIPVQYLERSFGFKKDERGVYIADEEEAVWVRKIYDMAAQGYTLAAIKRYLNENNVKTVGGAKWLDSTVLRSLENEIYDPAMYFKHQMEDEWITTEISRKMIQDVDHSEVISSHIIESPVLGAITPMQLSGGVKTLILMAHDDNTKIFNASACGDNCAKWILEISKHRDITITLHHIMKFLDLKEPVRILNINQVVNNFQEYAMAAIDLV